MKKANRSLISICMLASMFSLVVASCNQPNTSESQPDNTDYTITIEEMSHGSIVTELETAKKGDTVTLTISPDAGYELAEGSLKVNGTVITSESFTMPGANVTISASFVTAGSVIEIEETNLELSATSELVAAYSHWSTELTDTGLNVKVVVEDQKLLVTKGDFGKSDGIALAYSTYKKAANPLDGVKKLQVNAYGEFEVASYNGSAFAKADATGVEVSTSYIANAEAETVGYVVEASLTYEALGVTKDTVKNYLTLCPTLLNNNSRSAMIPASTATSSDYACDAYDQNSYLVLVDSNTYARNKFLYENGTFAFIDRGVNSNYDLSKDYFPEDANYADRKVVLSGTDNADNYLDFYQTNATELYVQATFKINEVYAGEPYGKVGIRIVDEGKNGVFNYIDCAGSGISAMDSRNAAYITVKGDYQWGSEVNTSARFSPKNGETMTLGIYRNGGLFQMFADGKLIGEMVNPGGIGNNVKAYPQLVSFNIGMEVTNYFSTDDKEVIESYLPKDYSVAGHVFKSPSEIIKNGNQYDLRNDTAESSGLVRLNGNDGQDNRLYFAVSSNEFMYARATMKVTDFYNIGDAWLKFGMALYDGGAGDALYFYADAFTGNAATANNINNITGKDYGLVLKQNGGWTKWITLDTTNKFNLQTKEVTMEAVYDHGKVYFFADGVLTSVNSYDAKTENLYFALTNFGYGMDITNYYGTTDKADVAIASTLAKIHTPTAIVLDGVANDDAFNYANNTLEVKGINNIDIKTSAVIADGGMYVTTIVESAYLPRDCRGENGWWSWCNIEYQVNGIQTYIGFGGNYSSINNGTGYAYASKNVSAIQATVVKNDNSKYVTTFEWFVPGCVENSTIATWYSVWDGSHATITKDGAEYRTAHQVTATGLVLG